MAAAAVGQQAAVLCLMVHNGASRSLPSMPRRWWTSHAGCLLRRIHGGVCPGRCGGSASTPVGEHECVLGARRRGYGQLPQARRQAVQDLGARRHRLAQRQGPEGAEARQAQGPVSRPLRTVAGHPDALQLLQRVATSAACSAEQANEEIKIDANDGVSTPYPGWCSEVYEATHTNSGLSFQLAARVLIISCPALLRSIGNR